VRVKTSGFSLFSCFFVTREPFMDVEVLAVVLGAVLPLYPALFVIYQKIGKYDVVCEEFGMLRDEHERTKEKYHGN